MFYDAYYTSQLYASRYLIKNRWRKLNKHLEFKSVFVTVADRENLYNHIIIRSNNEKCYSKLVACLTVSNMNFKYQQLITLFNIDKALTIVRLDQIPPYDLIFIQDNIFTTYDTLRIDILELYEKGKEDINLGPETQPYVTHFLLASRLFSENNLRKWEELWNTEMIVQTMNELRISYKIYLSYLPYLSGKKKLIRIITHPLYIFLSSKIMIKFIFWTKNIIIARQLREKYKIDFEKELSNINPHLYIFYYKYRY
ncbi:hypothetical protein IM40_04510 [Candidatus Paracaedimonas acanthamoebae]|nr:hypothetical protein IM40_04510 [Candidatus Paracaedimonas acanthamoebae]